MPNNAPAEVPAVRFQRVCYYCLDCLNAEGYKMVNLPSDDPQRLTIVPGNHRCDYCELRENGKLWVRSNWWKADDGWRRA